MDSNFFVLVSRYQYYAKTSLVTWERSIWLTLTHVLTFPCVNSFSRINNQRTVSFRLKCYTSTSQTLTENVFNWKILRQQRYKRHKPDGLIIAFQPNWARQQQWDKNNLGKTEEVKNSVQQFVDCVEGKYKKKGSREERGVGYRKYTWVVSIGLIMVDGGIGLDETRFQHGRRWLKGLGFNFV